MEFLIIPQTFKSSIECYSAGDTCYFTCNSGCYGHACSPEICECNGKYEPCPTDCAAKRCTSNCPLFNCNIKSVVNNVT